MNSTGLETALYQCLVNSSAGLGLGIFLLGAAMGALFVSLQRSAFLVSVRREMSRVMTGKEAECDEKTFEV